MDDAPRDGPTPDRTLELPAGERVAVSRDGELRPGNLLGRFVLRERLGEGGMGVVYAACDPDLGRDVAVKLVRDEAPALRARLLREGQAMARLEHPNVVRVLEVGSVGTRLFIAMELIDGATLTRWLADARRPWREIVAMFAQAGAGLVAVHDAGLIHRDFKPDNVLVDHQGRARVADFGLARVERDSAGDVSPAFAASLTRTGVMVGTPGFMAPEQQAGATVDARADQYSFCVALREALGADWASLPRPLRAAVTRGLAYDPAERFASVDALLSVIARATSRTRRVVSAALVVAACALAGGGLAMAVSWAARDDDTPVLAANPPVELDAAAGSLDPSVTPDASAVPPPSGERDEIAASPPPSVKSDASTASPSATPPAAARPAPATASAIAARGGPQPAAGSGVTLLPPVPFVRGPDDPPPAEPPPKVTLGPTPRAHRDGVRTAISRLGYRGLDLASLDADPAGTLQRLIDARDAVIAAGTPDDLAVAIGNVQIGQAHRRAGDCGRARTAWAAAKKLLSARREAAGVGGDNHEFLWRGRAELGIGLCELAAADNLVAEATLQRAIRLVSYGSAADSEHAEIQLAIAIATYEGGDTYRGESWLGSAWRHVDDATFPALKTWADAVGATPTQ